MPNIWDPGAADALVGRVRRLSPDRRPLWGRMSCVQMIVHAADACGLYLGEITAAFRPSVLRYPPLKQLVVYALPFPRHVSTSPELLIRQPGEWSQEVDVLCAAIRRFEAAHGRTDWPRHPVFGRLTPRAVGVLAWRHTDHHLRQFGE